MPPIDSSNTLKEEPVDDDRFRPPNDDIFMGDRFYPLEAGVLAELYWTKMKYPGKDRKPHGRITGWNVPHIQKIQEAMGLQCVPKKLHDTKTGQVCAMSGSEGALEFATVSHVWDMTDGVDWSDLSRKIGERLSVPYVWVDKTCINQKAEEEKGQEIKKMAEYYSSAKHNVIILSEISMAAAVDAWKEEGMKYYTRTHVHAAELAAKLMNHRYFTRVWTMQEQRLARDNFLLLEDGWVHGHDLDDLLRSLKNTLTYQKVIRFNEHVQDMFCNCQRRKSLTSCEWQKSVREPLVEVWRRAQGRRCTNPKDIIWGVISLVEGGDRLKATYNDALSDVLTELLTLGNRLGEVLTIMNGMRGSQDGHKDLACWQLQATGKVPHVLFELYPRLKNAQNVQFTLDKRALGATAYLLDQWLDGHDFDPELAGEKLLRYPMKHQWTHHNRSWFVPIWWNEISTKGVVLLDLNSEENKIHRVRTMAEGKLSTKALFLATATNVWIGGT